MIFSERNMNVYKEKDELDASRDIRTIVNIQYTKRKLSVRCCRKSIPESEERDESVLLKHCFTTLPLTITTDHRPSLNHHLPTLLSLDLGGPPTYSTEPRVRGRSKGRRRPAPKEAKPRNGVSTMVRPN